MPERISDERLAEIECGVGDRNPAFYGDTAEPRWKVLLAECRRARAAEEAQAKLLAECEEFIEEFSLGSDEVVAENLGFGTPENWAQSILSHLRGET